MTEKSKGRRSFRQITTPRAMSTVTFKSFTPRPVKVKGSAPHYSSSRVAAQSSRSRESLPTRRRQRIWCQSEKQKRLFGNILDLMHNVNEAVCRLRRPPLSRSGSCARSKLDETNRLKILLISRQLSVRSFF